jgi:hypothetical protein
LRLHEAASRRLDWPGKIAAIYDVPLPPNRTLDIMAHPTFTAMTQKPRSHFMDASID